jgi:argininosuccinate lyase
MTRIKKPWAGRFKKATAESVERFTASIAFDKRLYPYDIEGSIAHVTMLASRKIISREEASKIIAGLKGIFKDIRDGKFQFQASDEDIHMAIEKELIRRVGAVGGKLHTARSRNDQVVMDVRLFLRKEILEIVDLIEALQKELLKIARQEIQTIMPGYTHLQKAQPVLLSHYLLAFVEMFDRDTQRLKDGLRRVNVSPLGSAALAGTSLPIDRKFTAEKLHFHGISANSIDAVADRDFISEFIFASATLMMHLSRFCEDLILWMTAEFGFVDISDAYTTGSSIMPQKKNPDIAELIRGKTARVYGNLMAIMTLQKGLPMAYNRDLQEDKEPLFDTVDTVKGCLSIFTEMIGHVQFHSKTMYRAAQKGFVAATDIAEYLVKRGVPFRKAHEIVGKIVAYCIEQKKELESLTLKEYQKFCKAIDQNIQNVIKLENAVNARKHAGGTATKVVLERIEDFEKKLGKI